MSCADPHSGHDAHDSTSCGLGHAVPDFARGLLPAASLGSRPLAGRRLGLVMQTLGEGVAPEVNEAIQAAARHLESLGATVEEVGAMLRCGSYYDFISLYTVMHLEYLISAGWMVRPCGRACLATMDWMLCSVKDDIKKMPRVPPCLNGLHGHQVSLPTFGAGLPAYYVLALSEASSNLSR